MVAAAIEIWNIYDSLNDAADLAGTLTNPTATVDDKQLAVAMFALGMVDPTPGNCLKKVVDPKILLSRQRRREMTPNKTKKFTKQMQQDGYGNYPEIDVYDVDGDLIIKDGHHRARAAVNAGVDEVPINIIPVTDEAMKQTLRNQVFDAKIN